VDLLVKALEKEQIEGKVNQSHPNRLSKQASYETHKIPEDVDMSDEDVEMQEVKSEKPSKKPKAEKVQREAKRESRFEEEPVHEPEYNYLDDESAIRAGNDVSQSYSDDKHMKQVSPDDEEFPEDDVDPIVYMGLVNQKK
jgi:hypothetical protein